MIVEKINEMKEKKIRQYPTNSWRASMLGHPCDRYLIYERTRWQEKKLYGVDLQYIFDMGNEIEKITIKDLEEAGFSIHQQQRDFIDRELGITGHIDGMIEIDGKFYPIEIKSCSDSTFREITSYEDLKRSKKQWLRNYPVQLNLYLYFTSKEKGVLLFKNKQSGQYKEVWVDFDWDLADKIIKRVQRLNEYLESEELPPKINDETCLECPYAHICCPEIANQSNIGIGEDGELEKMLKRWEELKPLAKEFQALDKQLKEVGKAMEKDVSVIGNWIFKRQVIEGVRKPSPGGPYKMVKIVIERLS